MSDGDLMTDQTTVTAWVLAAQKGDVRAFDALVLRFRPAVRAVVRSLLDSEDICEDVGQAVFLAAFRHIRSLGRPDRFAPWLHAIARNEARRAYRAGKPTHSLDEFDALVVKASRTMSDAAWASVDASLDAGPVDRAVDELDERQAVCARLVYIEGWSVAEAALFLDLPVTTVKWRLHEARRALRGRFPDLGDNP
ncbi:MAG: RNA polymerase sigma factor [Fimbriimonadaceae bacterium]|nr:RNA polymerase sigma factor [Fimbriimonadaceae bacterium]